MPISVEVQSLTIYRGTTTSYKAVVKVTACLKFENVLYSWNMQIARSPPHSQITLKTPLNPNSGQL